MHNLMYAPRIVSIKSFFACYLNRSYSGQTRFSVPLTQRKTESDVQEHLISHSSKKVLNACRILSGLTSSGKHHITAQEAY